MAVDGAASIQGCAIRVLSRLNADGTVPVGTKNVWQANTLVKLSAKPNFQKGKELLVETACGTPYVNYKDFDRIKYYDVTLTIIAPDPEAMELITSGSGSLITSGANSIGYQVPQLGQGAFPTGVSIEVWTKAILNNFQAPGARTFTDGVLTSGSAVLTSAAGAAFTAADVGSPVTGTGIPANTTIATYTSATSVTMSASATASGSGLQVTVSSLINTPWYRWVMPRAYLWPDAVDIENKETPIVFGGFANENPNWAVGPDGTWTTTHAAGSGTALPSGRVLQYARDLALPTPLQAGYQASTY